MTEPIMNGRKLLQYLSLKSVFVCHFLWNYLLSYFFQVLYKPSVLNISSKKKSRAMLLMKVQLWMLKLLQKPTFGLEKKQNKIGLPCSSVYVLRPPWTTKSPQGELKRSSSAWKCFKTFFFKWSNKAKSKWSRLFPHVTMGSLLSFGLENHFSSTCFQLPLFFISKPLPSSLTSHSRKFYHFSKVVLSFFISSPIHYVK